MKRPHPIAIPLLAFFLSAGPSQGSELTPTRVEPTIGGVVGARARYSDPSLTLALELPGSIPSNVRRISC